MAAMILLIWFGIIPFLGIIITRSTLLASADSQTGGWITGGSANAGPFCVDPEALIVMADGSKKPLKNVKIGDSISSNSGSTNLVTGILRVRSETHRIVSIHGIKMSESHPVFYERWIRAGAHPEAISLDIKLNELICLNTTNHSALMFGSKNIIVGDWDEASEEEDQKRWVSWVSKILNGKSISQKLPTNVPLCSNSVRVCTSDNRWVHIDTINIGDKVLGRDGYTRVIGIYTGIINSKSKTSDWISDGVWIYKNKNWVMAEGLFSDSSETLSGRFLVTEAETFYLMSNSDVYLVRDFTEVGASRMNECYSWFEDEINKKD
jgi:hypothetical protein